jgi:hypothetical protein
LFLANTTSVLLATPREFDQSDEVEFEQAVGPVAQKRRVDNVWKMAKDFSRRAARPPAEANVMKIRKVRRAASMFGFVIMVAFLDSAALAQKGARPAGKPSGSTAKRGPETEGLRRGRRDAQRPASAYEDFIREELRKQNGRNPTAAEVAPYLELYEAKYDPKLEAKVRAERKQRELEDRELVQQSTTFGNIVVGAPEASRTTHTIRVRHKDGTGSIEVARTALEDKLRSMDPRNGEPRPLRNTVSAADYFAAFRTVDSAVFIHHSNLLPVERPLRALKFDAATNTLSIFRGAPPHGAAERILNLSEKGSESMALLELRVYLALRNKSSAIASACPRL